jgi:hypothetical protein
VNSVTSSSEQRKARLRLFMSNDPLKYWLDNLTSSNGRCSPSKMVD